VKPGALPDPFDPAGLEELLARAESDPEAARELDFVADLVAAAERERAVLAPPPVPARPRSGLWLGLAAAVVLAALALALWRGRDGSGTSRALLAELGAPRYVAGELRGAEPELAAELARAMEPYVAGRHAEAVASLEALLARVGEHGPARFYLAAALEQLGELARAEAEYERAAASPDALLAEHAHLRLALLRIARGERERGRADLRALAEAGGELATSARTWLERTE
jgi:tetratricopeptide (TPR) repeat protein